MSFWKTVKKLIQPDEPPAPEKPVSRPVTPSPLIKAEPPPKISDLPPTPAPDVSPPDEAPSEAAPEPPPSDEATPFRAVRVERGAAGWGGPLIIQPTAERRLVYSVTGGGIHPVAQKIADLTGATPFDGFTGRARFEEIAVAVIDCAATIRMGLYPMKAIPTVDVLAADPNGPLRQYINAGNFVSDVSEHQVMLLEDIEHNP